MGFPRGRRLPRIEEAEGEVYLALGGVEDVDLNFQGRV
jgi:hypothetical protein